MKNKTIPLSVEPNYYETHTVITKENIVPSLDSPEGSGTVNSKLEVAFPIGIFVLNKT